MFSSTTSKVGSGLVPRSPEIFLARSYQFLVATLAATNSSGYNWNSCLRAVGQP